MLGEKHAKLYDGDARKAKEGACPGRSSRNRYTPFLNS
jgi:hypothetical protein